jgi:hypothetical protein
METDMLSGLNWRVSGPTPQSFVAHLLALIQHEQQQQIQIQQQHHDQRNSTTSNNQSFSVAQLQQVFDMCSYQIELSVGEHKLMTHKPSTVAIASIWNSIEKDHTKSHDGTPSIFHRQLIEVVSSLNSIQIEEQHFCHVKDTLTRLFRDGPATMQMRPTTPSSSLSSHTNPELYSQYQQQQRQDQEQEQGQTRQSTEPSPRSSVPSTQTQHHAPCTEGSKNHGSPNCVSRRDLYNSDTNNNNNNNMK